MFRSVHRLLPGCWMTVSVEDMSTQIKQYYTPRAILPQHVPQERIDAEVEAAVVSRLVSDVPVGVFLSGGVDSSIIAAVARSHAPHVSTYSLGFPGLPGDELQYAEEVARHLGTRHRSFHFDSQKFHDLLPQVAEALDEPIGDQAMLPLFWLCREAANEVKVVLSGEGGDELFSGYRYYQPFAMPSWPGAFAFLNDNPGRIAPSFLGSIETASGFPILAGQGERHSLMLDPPSGVDAWETEIEARLAKARDPLQRASLADLAGWLPDDLLVKLDRMAMRHSLEGRAPFLTPRLADCALNLAPDQRMRGADTKIALRLVAEKWLPSEVMKRPKQGFVLPMRRWLKEWFERTGGVRTYFRSASTLPGLNADAVIEIVQRDIKQGLQRERLLFALIMLTEWWRAFDPWARTARSTSPAIF